MNELAPLANITDICEGRNEAIARWLGIYDFYHAEQKKAANVCIGGNLGLSVGDGRYSRHDTDGISLSEAFVSSREGARERFETILTRTIDRRCWQEMLDMLGFGDVLDAQARAEFRESLDKDPPAFTPETCRATFGHIWESRTHYFQRGIATLFTKLDRRFRSHNGFKFGARVIIEGAIEKDSYWWSRYERRDVINDVERTLYELAGLPPPREQTLSPTERREYEKRGKPLPESTPPLTKLIEQAYREKRVPSTIEGKFLEARLFKNGNVHLWFRDADLHLKLNHILADYYGEAIGDGYDSHDAEAEPQYHVTPAKNFGEFFTSDALAASIVDRYASYKPGETVLEPSAGKGALASKAVAAGAIVDCIEIQPGHAHELALSGLYRSVECRDFLQFQPPAAEMYMYDHVLMNPPFDRGRDCDHVRHAWQFLKPGGTLIAIMAARAEFGDDARHQALHRIVESAEGLFFRADHKWHDLPERSFAHAGTNVNTVVLAIRKPTTDI